jgi:hypothetical protein
VKRNVLRVQGGEVERGSLTQFSGCSVKAHCIGKRSYLEPNSGSLHVPIEGRVANGEKRNQNHVENSARAYLERIRNGMQEPIEGLLAQCLRCFIKGGYSRKIAQQHSIFMLETFIYTLNNAKA